jgi:hypothetical protein
LPLPDPAIPSDYESVVLSSKIVGSEGELREISSVSVINQIAAVVSIYPRPSLAEPESGRPLQPHSLYPEARVWH